MNSKSRRALFLVGRILLVGVVSYGVFLGYTAWRTMLRLKQVRNCADLQTMTFAIDSFHEKTGRYPASIREAVNLTSMTASNKKYYAAQKDVWGGAFHYSRRERGFTLVSYGRDSEPDASTGTQPARAEARYACRDLDSDVFSDESGIIRCCGK